MLSRDKRPNRGHDGEEDEEGEEGEDEEMRLGIEHDNTTHRRQKLFATSAMVS